MNKNTAITAIVQIKVTISMWDVIKFRIGGKELKEVIVKEVTTASLKKAKKMVKDENK